MTTPSTDHNEASDFFEGITVFLWTALVRSNFSTSTASGFTPEHLENPSKGKIFRQVDFETYPEY
jgi:hypothetical protein